MIVLLNGASLRRLWKRETAPSLKTWYPPHYLRCTPASAGPLGARASLPWECAVQTDILVFAKKKKKRTSTAKIFLF